ncbi:MAG: DnaA regulatory inactivator Hda [Burkholderiales bacterium]|nr:DnaA regulatory inactivator Hda [Burkholderiales bacterium]
MKQLALDIVAALSPTLDNFVPGRNAELLHNLERMVAGEADERFIYIWGAAGSGRSHLLMGAVAAARDAGASAACIACAAETQFGEGIERMDCVAVDNADRLGEAAQVALFNLYNLLREGRGALIVSGDAPPMQLKLRQDLVTRLGWGLVYQVHALTDEEKTRALMVHAEGRGFRLSGEVCNYLLHHVRRDLPTLLAMLDALDRHSLETKRQITVPLVRELLQAAPSPGSANADKK